MHMNAGKIKPKLLKTALFIIIAVLMASCTKNYYELYEMENGEGLSDYIKLEDWESTAPIAYGQLSLKDILDQFANDFVGEYTEPGSDQNLLFLSFDEHVRSKNIEQLIEIGNEVYNNRIYGNELVSSPLSVRKSFNFNLVSFDRARAIKKIKVKSGSIDVNITSNMGSTGKIIFQPHIRAVDDFSEPFIKREYDITSGNWSTSDNIDISDHYVYTGNSPTYDSTYFIIEGELILDGAGPFTSDDSLEITTTINGVEYSAIWGYFGNDTLIDFQPDEVPIDLISDNDPWHFVDPRISVCVKSSMGVPIRVKAQDVFMECMNLDPNLQQLFFNSGNDTFKIDVPYSDQFGVDTLVERSFTDDIDDISGSQGLVYTMNNNPNSLQYTSFAETNINDIIDLNQWLTDTSNIDMNIILDIPLYGLTKQWTITDTLSAGIGGEDQDEIVDFVEELVLRLNFTNGLPLDLEIQGIMIDSSGNKLDSLFDEGYELIAPAANTVKDEKVPEPNAYTSSVPNSKVTNIVLTGDKIDNFFKTEDIVFRISSTSWEADDEKYIRIYSYNTLNIQLAAKIRLSGTTHFRDL